MATHLRRVSTSFIELVPNDSKGSNYLLLCKRSDKVNSFKHHWASISGSIERDISIPTTTTNTIINPFSFNLLNTEEHYLEDSFTCAKREIEEETKLSTNQSLYFERSGRVQWILNEQKTGGFVVYPFLFRIKLNREDEIKSLEDVKNYLKHIGFQIDWEHETFDLFDTEQFLFESDQSVDVPYPTLRNTVPDLRDTLSRVYYSRVEKTLERNVKDCIVDNFTDGAGQITFKAIDVVMRNALRVYSNLSFESIPPYFSLKFSHAQPEVIRAIYFYKKMKDLVWHLDHCRQEMPSIGNFSAYVFGRILCLKQSETDIEEDELRKINELLKTTTLRNWVESIETRLNHCLDEYHVRNQLIAKNFLSHITERMSHQKTLSILTHSWSSTVLNCLEALIKHCQNNEIHLSIFMTESLPQGEGHKTFKALERYIDEQMIHLHMCNDNGVPELLTKQRIDAMVVGADSILPPNCHANTTIVNKCGTKKLYELSRLHAVPFLVVSDSLKVMSPLMKENMIHNIDIFENVDIDDINIIQESQAVNVVESLRYYSQAREKIYGP